MGNVFFISFQYLLEFVRIRRSPSICTAPIVVHYQTGKPSSLENIWIWKKMHRYQTGKPCSLENIWIWKKCLAESGEKTGKNSAWKTSDSGKNVSQSEVFLDRFSSSRVSFSAVFLQPMFFLRRCILIPGKDEYATKNHLWKGKWKYSLKLS